MVRVGLTRNEMIENPAGTHSRPWRHRWFWSQKSDYARLQRELKTFGVDLDLLEARTRNSDNAWAKAVQTEINNVHVHLDAEDNKESDSPWAMAARCEIQNAQECLNTEDNIEGGWMSLHAARRHAVYGLSPCELPLQATILRAEATKIQSWRGNEMVNLLDVKDEALTVHRIISAMALRDEYFSNQYHKIWLIGSQISILLGCCGLGLLLLIPLVVSSSRQLQGTLIPWGYQMVAAVLFFGLLGAAFSAAGSLMNADATSKIPERVANQFVTIARALFGSGVGLAGYAFYQSKILNFHFSDEGGPGSALAIAFLFGFGGEILIARVLGSLGSRQSETQK